MSGSHLSAPPPSDTIDDDPLVGTPYRFVARLGQGGMGEVVEAEHERLGHHVAIKLLRADDFARLDLKDRMRLEAQACARIRHDNLVLVTDFGETRDGRAYVVMELLRGSSVGDELRRRGALPPAEAVAIILQALAGLEAAHAAGIVHRDIKPDNVFLADVGDGRRLVKVLDFGIAKIVDSACDPRTPRPLREPTAEGMTVGTPRYASPEQSRAERDIDARSDLYSIGWLLHVLLTGRDPFPHRKGAADLARAHQTEMPPLPSALSSRPIPSDLDIVVMKAIAKKREDRHASAHAFRIHLEQIAELLARPLPAAVASFPLAPGDPMPPEKRDIVTVRERAVAAQRIEVPNATVELGPSLAAFGSTRGALPTTQPISDTTAGGAGATDRMLLPRLEATRPMTPPRRRVVPIVAWCAIVAVLILLLAIALRVLGVW